MEKELITILFVGEAQTGKSALAYSLLQAYDPTQESLPLVDGLPELVSDITVSDPGMTIPIQAWDSSSKRSEQTLQKITSADIICVVYDMSRPQTLDEAQRYWLPTIQRIHHQDYDHDHGANERLSPKSKSLPPPPIILVGNKSDLAAEMPEQHVKSLKRQISDMMTAFKGIEASIQVSVKTAEKITEMFYLAEKSLIYPTYPLYDPSTGRLKPLFEKALERMFRISDADKDMLLSNEELNNFQKKCFQTPLQHRELLQIKTLIYKKNPAGLTYMGTKPESVLLAELQKEFEMYGTCNNAANINDYFVNLEGFCTLQLLFLLKAKQETVWTALNAFGYDYSVQVSDLLIKLNVQYDPIYSRVELTSNVIQFITALFVSYDKDNDSALNPDELQDLFKTTPGVPFHDLGPVMACTTADRGYLTIQGYLSLFKHLAFTNPNKLVAWLVYLGYPYDINSAITIEQRLIFNPRRAEFKHKKTLNTVYRVGVLGAPGCGKTSMLLTLLGKTLDPLSSSSSTTSTPATTTSSSSSLLLPSGQNQRELHSADTAVNAVSIDGVEKCLILTEIQTTPLTISALNLKTLAMNYDALAFLYDLSDPNSFGYTMCLQRKLYTPVKEDEEDAAAYLGLEAEKAQTPDFNLQTHHANVSMPALPVVFIGTKSDLKADTVQLTKMSPEEYSSFLDIPGPFSGSSYLGTMKDPLIAVTRAAMEPHAFTPRVVEDQSKAQILVRAAVVASTVAAAVYLGYKLLKRRH